MDVSKNKGVSPQSSILRVFYVINHPFWGAIICGNTQMRYKLGEIIHGHPITKVILTEPRGHPPVKAPKFLSSWSRSTLYWLVDRDPIMAYYNPHIITGYTAFHPPYTANDQGFGHCSVGQDPTHGSLAVENQLHAAAPSHFLRSTFKVYLPTESLRSVGANDATPYPIRMVSENRVFPGMSMPIGSMYGIFTYTFIYHTTYPNVGKYTIHGSYGMDYFTRL